MKLIIGLLLFFVVHSSYVLGESNPEAHTHGRGHLTLIFDEGRMLLELVTPAANMLGFESHPRDSEQKTALETLSRTLHQPNAVVTLVPDCSVTSVDVDLPFKLNKSDEDDHSAHKHHKGSHDHHRAHRDIHTRYEWQCLKSSPPKISLRYFSLYPGFEKIRAEWIVNGSQGFASLSKEQHVLELLP